MKRLLMVTPVVVLALLLVSTPDASAFGRRNKHCAEEYAAASECAPAPMSVTWVEQTVTAYRTEWHRARCPSRSPPRCSASRSRKNSGP